jgi:hypothetical protein
VVMVATAGCNVQAARALGANSARSLATFIQTNADQSDGWWHGVCRLASLVSLLHFVAHASRTQLKGVAHTRVGLHTCLCS